MVDYAQKSVEITLNHFDPGNPNYQVVQFKDVPVFATFRTDKEWMIKAGFKSAQNSTNGIFKFLPDDQFVLANDPFTFEEIICCPD